MCCLGLGSPLVLRLSNWQRRFSNETFALNELCFVWKNKMFAEMVRRFV